MDKIKEKIRLLRPSVKGLTMTHRIKGEGDTGGWGYQRTLDRVI
jgi:hypothetical protein